MVIWLRVVARQLRTRLGLGWYHRTDPILVELFLVNHEGNRCSFCQLARGPQRHYTVTFWQTEPQVVIYHLQGLFESEHEQRPRRRPRHAHELYNLDDHLAGGLVIEPSKHFVTRTNMIDAVEMEGSQADGAWDSPKLRRQTLLMSCARL